MSQMTLRMGVERAIKEQVPEVERVEAVGLPATSGRSRWAGTTSRRTSRRRPNSPAANYLAARPAVAHWDAPPRSPRRVRRAATPSRWAVPLAEAECSQDRRCAREIPSP